MTSELNPHRRRRLPVVISAELAECGLACLVMVGQWHGHEIDLNGLRQRFSLSLTGTTLRGLMGIADQLSLTSRALRVDVASLSKVAAPAILHWDLNHFVVLKSAADGRFVIHDPARGARTLSGEEMSRHFTGVVLELTPAANFHPVAAAAPMRLSGLWSRMTGFWSTALQVLALSLALQIVAFAAPFQIQLVVDHAIGQTDENLLTVLAIGFGGLIVLQAVIEALRAWALQLFGSMLTFQMVGNLIRHLLRLPADFFEKRHVGDILSRIGSTSAIQDALTRGVVTALIDGIMALIAALILFLYSPPLALIVVGSLLGVLALSAALFPAMRARTEERLMASAREQSHLMETVRAATVIKLMGGEAERESAWRNLYASVINATVSIGKLQVSLGFLQSLIVGLQTVLVIYFGARAILDAQGFSVGMLLAFLSLRQTFSDRAVSFVNQAIQFRFLRLHLERIGDIAGATPEAGPAAGAATFAVSGGLEARALSFRYGATDPLVLDGVNLTIAPGDFIAITGPSGGGKSTLFKLLLGLCAPTSGEIRLDGQPASPERWRVWRTWSGVVSQDDRLLSGSIADNIAFFDPEMSMPRVVAAARATRIDDEIRHMPMQYQTMVGDMGSTLSGGQKQRLLLARALYRQPSMLFLDEGTANLDEATEAAIADFVASLPITRVVVAHSPALIRRATRVLHVERGQVREIGDRPMSANAPSRFTVISA